MNSFTHLYVDANTHVHPHSHTHIYLHTYYTHMVTHTTSVVNSQIFMHILSTYKLTLILRNTHDTHLRKLTQSHTFNKIDLHSQSVCVCLDDMFIYRIRIISIPLGSRKWGLSIIYNPSKPATMHENNIYNIQP